MIALLPLLLSEVLANEPGSATSLEFIELVAWHPVQEGSVLLFANGDTARVPEVPLDSGAFLVVCRDPKRFEAHFGDSSGRWGDSPAEDYPLQQAAMSLPNGAGWVSLVSSSGEDRFDWEGDAPDGTSYERVSDSVWQPTDASVRATPGRRNFGLPARFDWSLERITLAPGPWVSGEPVQIAFRVRNVGLDYSSGSLESVVQPHDTLPLLAYEGGAGAQVELVAAIMPRPGLNEVRARLSPDERTANNEGRRVFFAGLQPIHFSEVYPVPAAGQPEWIELWVAENSGLHALDVAITDGQDTACVPAEWWSLASGFVVITADSLSFRMSSAAPPFVVQPDGWPALNNDGDSLRLLVEGSVVDLVAWPSPGSRRGVSYERVGRSDSWSWSLAPAGSTPGQTNSIDVSYVEGIELNVDPNPFAASQGELARVNYRVPFGAQAELRVFSGDGRLVRTLFERRPVVSGEVSWDGKSDRGRPIPIGIYVLQFRLFEPREQVHLGTVVVAR